MNANNSMPTRIFALVLGLVINAFGNGLTIATNMGSAPVTASAVNLAHFLHLSVGLMIFAIGAITAVINQILIRQWDGWRFFGELVFVSSFGYFVNFSASLFSRLGIPKLLIIARIFLCLLGIVIFCTAISFYQRANLVMHPNDDTTNILRFLYFKGHVEIAQLVSFVVPILIIITTTILTHHIYAFNIGTLFCILFNGALIGWADRHVWHGLSHNFRVKKTA